MRILATLLVLLFQVAAVTASELEIIELQNRPAEEIVPLIQPMLDNGETVNGRGFQLILRADAARQTQIRELVRKLDRAAAQLMISVFQGSERDREALGIGAAIRYEDKDTSGKRLQVTGNAIGTRARMSDNPLHQLRIAEGTVGYIETGKSVPYLAAQEHSNSVEFKNVTTGFYVLPRLSGDRVTLDISPHHDSLDASRPGVINTRHAATTISGQLGQWIPLGGTIEQARHSSTQSGTTYSTRDRHSERIWIKAEQVQ